MTSETSQGEPWPDATSRLPVYFASGSASIFLRTTTTAVTHSKSRAIERFHRLIHLAACSLIYNTDTINIPQPLTLNPHLYLFIDHPTRLFCHANPCIGTCLIALSTIGVPVGLVATSPNVFGMSSTHARVVLCIPARLLLPHTVSSCGFVGVACAVTFCNYCCKSHRFNTQCEILSFMAAFLMLNPQPFEHEPTLISGEPVCWTGSLPSAPPEGAEQVLVQPKFRPH